MAELLLGTAVVSLDEPCLGLYELHLQSPGNRGLRRFQVIVVMREDRPAEHRIDLGPASRFKEVAQFRIPGGALDEDTRRFHIEHTVGELKDIADQLRSERYDSQPVTDLVAGYHRTLDIRRSRRRGRTVFGVS